METHHLSVDEWDELLVGSVSERASVHLDGCPECQSVVDRLTRDAMPRSARTGRRANYFVPAIAAGGVAAIAGAVAIVYGAAYVHSTQREAEMGARVLSLEAQASASDPASAAIAAAGSNESATELKRLRETLRQLQTDAVAVASLRSQMEGLKQQLAESENRHAGDEATLGRLRAEYEAKTADNEKKLSEVRAELAATQGKLTLALKPADNETKSAQSVEAALAVYLKWANVPGVLLAGSKAQKTADPGFIALTADPASVADVWRLVDAKPKEQNELLKAFQVYFVSEDPALERCLKKAASSGKVIKMDFSAAASQAYYSPP